MLKDDEDVSSDNVKNRQGTGANDKDNIAEEKNKIRKNDNGEMRTRKQEQRSTEKIRGGRMREEQQKYERKEKKENKEQEKATSR